MSEYKLTTNLIALSFSKTWDEAKLEWTLEDLWREANPGTCLCGHFPILETCTLKNKINTNLATVGNCCVKKFTNLPSDLIFQAVNRIQKNIGSAMNAETIVHSYEKGWITDWERKFYLNTWRKRKLTVPQQLTRVQINQRVLSNIIKTS